MNMLMHSCSSMPVCVQKGVKVSPEVHQILSPNAEHAKVAFDGDTTGYTQVMSYERAILIGRRVKRVFEVSHLQARALTALFSAYIS